ncbi:MAG: tetratricopeptide repeat protein [Deltaproteobacteria bacterium]|jgi:tetratricopeptide (TPR) repeat protein
MFSGSYFKKALLIWSLIISIAQLSVLPTFAKASPSPPREYPSGGEVNGEEIRNPGLDDNAATSFSQGLAYYDQGRWQEAIKAFERAALREPDYQLAYFALGITYSRLEFWEKALASFAKAVALNPYHAESYLGLGVAYTVFGRDKDALEVCRKAVRIKPEYAQAHYALALIYLKLGNRASALEEWGVLQKLDRTMADEVIRLIGQEKGSRPR